MKWFLLVLLLAGCAADEAAPDANAHVNGRAGFYTSVGGGVSR
jgi:hypothetical protein